MVQLFTSEDPGVRRALHLLLQEEERAQRASFKPAVFVNDIKAVDPSRSRQALAKNVKSLLEEEDAEKRHERLCSLPFKDNCHVSFVYQVLDWHHYLKSPDFCEELTIPLAQIHQLSKTLFDVNTTFISDIFKCDFALFSWRSTKSLSIRTHSRVSLSCMATGFLSFMTFKHTIKVNVLFFIVHFLKVTSNLLRWVEGKPIHFLLQQLGKSVSSKQGEFILKPSFWHILLSNCLGFLLFFCPFWMTAAPQQLQQCFQLQKSTKNYRQCH